MFKKFKKGAFSWAMYDWANSAFTTTVQAALFPIFFGSYWSAGMKGSESTMWLGYGLSLSGLLVAFSAPIIGAFADRGGRRKRFLLFFAGIAMLGTASFYFIGKGEWQMALIIYVICAAGFLAADSLYNSLIVDVSTSDNVDYLSGFGYSIGYLGGGLLFLVNILMVQQPHWFGLVPDSFMSLHASLDNGQFNLSQARKEIAAMVGPGALDASVWQNYATMGAEQLKTLISDEMGETKALAVKFSFLSVAIWWLVFSLPLAFRVHEHRDVEKVSLGTAIREGFGQLKETIAKIRQLRMVVIFLFAYFLYIDGVHTIINMATKIGQDIGFKDSDLITAILLVQFIGFPAALFMGWIGQKIGPKPVIFFGVSVYFLVTFLVYFIPDGKMVDGKLMPPEPWQIAGFAINQFYFLAVLIALVQGAVQSMSRSLYSRLIDHDKSGEFYGFYNMLGKYGALLGPLLVGIIAGLAGSTRLGVLSLAVLFALGLILLSRVKVPERHTADG